MVVVQTPEERVSQALTLFICPDSHGAPPVSRLAPRPSPDLGRQSNQIERRLDRISTDVRQIRDIIIADRRNSPPVAERDR